MLVKTQIGKKIINYPRHDTAIKVIVFDRRKYFVILARIILGFDVFVLRTMIRFRSSLRWKIHTASEPPSPYEVRPFDHVSVVSCCRIDTRGKDTLLRKENFVKLRNWDFYLSPSLIASHFARLRSCKRQRNVGLHVECCTLFSGT